MIPPHESHLDWCKHSKTFNEARQPLNTVNVARRSDISSLGRMYGIASVTSVSKRHPVFKRKNPNAMSTDAVSSNRANGTLVSHSVHLYASQYASLAS